jgi:hypothetical protein
LVPSLFSFPNLLELRAFQLLAIILLKKMTVLRSLWQ